MNFLYYTHLSDKVKEDIRSYMKKIDFEDDSEITRLYCYYNQITESFANYSINPDELLNEIDISYDDTIIIEIDLSGYYLELLKNIVKLKFSCKYHKLELFNKIANVLMKYGNEQVLNANYSLCKYIDIFKLIFKMKGMID